MRLAMVGTRGVPARYGGFETAVEEIGARLAEAGHDVTVYCRRDDDASSATYRNMHRIVVPALRRKSLETLTHTFASGIHALSRERFDVVFLFNAANAPLVPLWRRRGTPIAIHVDGLESRRAKWGRVGRRYYRLAEGLSVRWGDAIVADANAIAEYYEQEFGASSEVIAYGAPIIDDLDEEGLDAFGVTRDRFHLVVARFEPENHVVEIVRGYQRSTAAWPLLVVGGAPYGQDYLEDVRAAAAEDPRIRLVGPIWDQNLLDRLYFHAGTYVHGHSVGGTNPSLLRAMGAAAPVLALDTVFAREVLGEAGEYFAGEHDVGRLFEHAESVGPGRRSRGAVGRERARERYRWDDVGIAYEALAARLAAGSSRRKAASGRRRPPNVESNMERRRHAD